MSVWIILICKIYHLNSAAPINLFQYILIFFFRTTSLLQSGATVPRGNGVRRLCFIKNSIRNSFYFSIFTSLSRLLAEYQYAVKGTREMFTFVPNAIQSVRMTASTAYVTPPTVKLSLVKYDMMQLLR